MASTFKIPLSTNPQSFLIELGLIEYTIVCRWNDSLDSGWALDFYNGETAAPIVMNVPLVTGVNLLEGLEYLGFSGKFYAYTDGDDFAVPTFTNLGIESNVYFVTEIV